LDWLSGASATRNRDFRSRRGIIKIADDHRLNGIHAFSGCEGLLFPVSGNAASQMRAVSVSRQATHSTWSLGREMHEESLRDRAA
jgi:hypothetical protein